MQEIPSRRFNISDGMVMIAAITPSLVLIKIGVGFGIFEIGNMTKTGGLALGRELVEFFNVGGGCILAGLVPAVLILGLYRAKPSVRDAVRGPGLIACIIALAALILPVFWSAVTVAVESGLPYPNYLLPFNNLFGHWMFAASPMILGAWITLALLGRWRPNPTWTDRAGCVLGLCFLMIYLYAQIYFMVVVPISYLWQG